SLGGGTALLCKFGSERPAGRGIDPNHIAAKAIGYDKIRFHPNFNKTIGRIICWEQGLPSDLSITSEADQILVTFRACLPFEEHYSFHAAR
ncbi:MAG: hypothetical protein WBQ22_07670, partial [Bradyrhizobium sp.]